MMMDDFKEEIDAALKCYDRNIVMLEKTPVDFAATIGVLIPQAIKAFESRPPGLRHGVALDKYVTIILTQTAIGAKPIISIYFNLFSGYHHFIVNEHRIPHGQ